MTLLRRTEELILLAVLQLHENAYGVTIRRHLMEITDEHFSFASVYVPLDRLTERGFVTAIDGPPTKERGGRRRRFYRVTPTGLAALTEMERVRGALRQGVPQLAFGYPL